MTVVVLAWVEPHSLWNKPSWSMRLLSLDDKQLECHEKNDACRCKRVRLLVQKVRRVNLQVQGHEALHGDERASELHAGADPSANSVRVHDLGDPDRGIEE